MMVEVYRLIDLLNTSDTSNIFVRFSNGFSYDFERSDHIIRILFVQFERFVFVFFVFVFVFTLLSVIVWRTRGYARTELLFSFSSSFWFSLNQKLFTSIFGRLRWSVLHSVSTKTLKPARDIV